MIADSYAGDKGKYPVFSFNAINADSEILQKALDASIPDSDSAEQMQLPENLDREKHTDFELIQKTATKESVPGYSLSQQEPLSTHSEIFLVSRHPIVKAKTKKDLYKIYAEQRETSISGDINIVWGIGIIFDCNISRNIKSLIGKKESRRPIALMINGYFIDIVTEDQIYQSNLDKDKRLELFLYTDKKDREALKKITDTWGVKVEFSKPLTKKARQERIQLLKSVLSK